MPRLEFPESLPDFQRLFPEIDDLGLDVLECFDLAIEAQEKFASSGRSR